jgi:hypothetical protein
MKTHTLLSVIIGLFALSPTCHTNAQQMPSYRGRVLDINTKKPMAGVVVEAQLQKDALETGQRMVGRAKTDSYGQFVLRLEVNRSDIALIVSPKGSVSKLITLNGQQYMMNDIEHPFGWEMHPSTKHENIIYAGVREPKKK